MTPAEIADAIGHAHVLWPDRWQPTVTLAGVCARLWADLPAEWVAAALDQCACDHYDAPSPGAVRARCFELFDADLPPTVEVAWADVALGLSVSPDRRPEFVTAHALVGAAIDGIGGWVRLAEAPYPERLFGSVYGPLASQARAAAFRPPAVKDTMAAAALDAALSAIVDEAVA